MRSLKLEDTLGRHPKSDGRYAKLTGKQEARVDVIVARALPGPKRNAARFFIHDSPFPMLKSGQPKGNGEDIVFSYVTKAYSGKLNEVHNLPFKELPAPQAIHHRVSGHWEHRTRVMQATNHWFQKQLEHKRPNLTGE